MCIKAGSSDALASANGLAVFSCTLTVIGEEVLQFEVFGSTFNDRLNGCQNDALSQTTCSWPNDGINGIDMLCDYSVPYQISCILLLSGVTEPCSTQVICSNATGEVDPCSTQVICSNATGEADPAASVLTVVTSECMEAQF